MLQDHIPERAIYIMRRDQTRSMVTLLKHPYAQ